MSKNCMRPRYEALLVFGWCKLRQTHTIDIKQEISIETPLNNNLISLGHIYHKIQVLINPRILVQLN